MPLRLSVMVATVAAMVTVGSLAWWDAARDADAALEDFGHQQAIVALSLANNLSARLGSVRRDAQIISEGSAALPSVSRRYENVRVDGEPRDSSAGAGAQHFDFV